MTSPPTLETIKTLFVQAVGLSTAERAIFLEERCSGDPAVRARLEELLRAHDGATAYFGRQPLGRPMGEEPGTLVGRYRLLEHVGEGGFGAVWRAEQLEPVRREVALKVIKLGMDTKQVVARFEAERQALAVMDHPNIAKVLDGGMTDAGRPFFVMELVRGVPITRYCDEARLSTRDRLELFVQVCHAVEHAHQKGIVHRDIKPSNVLVSESDGRPVPKVIDFGIAKATSGSLTDKTLYTEHRQCLGTPEYMSPEQAGGSRLDIDTRSDVYSLGVLLYQLLTGTTPVHSESLRGVGHGEILRLVREVEPPRPSTRVGALGEQWASLAAARGTDPRTLQKLVRGDLDWITMRALEKERTRRYGSATALAQDVERFLADEPVEARPPSRAYRLSKLVRRNRLVVGAAAAVVLALVGGTAAATVGLVRAARSAAAATALNAFYDEMLLLIDPTRLRQRSGFAPPGEQPLATAPALDRDVSVVEMLLAAAESVQERFHDEPGLAAKIRETIGVTLLGLWHPEDASKQLDLAAQILARSPDASEADRLRLALLCGTAALGAGDDARAERLARAAHGGMLRVHGPDSPRTLHAAGVLGEILTVRGRYDEARVVLERTLAAQRRVLSSEHRDTIDTLNHLAELYFWQTKPLEAEPYAREAYALATRTLDPDDLVRVEAENGLGMVHEFALEHDLAVPLLRSALAKKRRILGGEHEGTAHTAFHLARCLVGEEQLAERERLTREAIATMRANGSHELYLPVMLRDLAALLFDRGAAEEGLALAREYAQFVCARNGSDSYRRHEAMVFLQGALARAGRADELQALVSREIATLRENRPDPDRLWTCQALSEMCLFLRRSGRLHESQEAWQGCLDIRSNLARRPDAGGEAIAFYGHIQLHPWAPGMRDVDGAIDFLERALQRGMPDRRAELEVLDDLTLAYALAGRPADAERTAARALETSGAAARSGRADDLYAHASTLLDSPLAAVRDPLAALPVLRRATEADATRADGWILLARASSAAGETGESRAAAERALALLAGSAEEPGASAAALGAYLRELALTEHADLRAGPTLRAATERFAAVAGAEPDRLGALGLARYRLGDHAEAAELLQEADRLNELRGLERNPAFDRVPLAMCLWRLGDERCARELLDSAAPWTAGLELPFADRRDLAGLLREARELMGIAWAE